MLLPSGPEQRTANDREAQARFMSETRTIGNEGTELAHHLQFQRHDRLAGPQDQQVQESEQGVRPKSKD